MLLQGILLGFIGLGLSYEIGAQLKAHPIAAFKDGSCAELVDTDLEAEVKIRRIFRWIRLTSEKYRIRT